MSPDSQIRRVLEELRFALAQADSTVPPPSLRSRVLTVATVERTAGHSFERPPAISPIEAYRRTVEAFSTLLLTLNEDEWHRLVLRDLTIQGLVGHLIGVERAFQAVVGGTAAVDPDHVAGTQSEAVAQQGRAPAETHQEWLDRAQQTLHQLASAALDEAITLHGFTLPVGGMLIVRSFEMWTHEEDIRRVTGRALVAPDASRLALMTEIAVGALPRAFGNAGDELPPRTVRIVLTGPGGGTWQTALDRGPVGASADVRIVVDATTFCRLVANRLAPEEAHASIAGDELLGRKVLASVASLALD